MIIQFGSKAALLTTNSVILRWEYPDLLLDLENPKKKSSCSRSWFYFPEEQNIKAKHNHAFFLGVPRPAMPKPSWETVTLISSALRSTLTSLLI